MSALDTLKALDQQRAQLVCNAKKEALERVHKAIAELKELGFDYIVLERAKPTTPQRTLFAVGDAEPGASPTLDSRCPICGIVTFPRHDASAHRSQQPKRPFTTEELAAANYSVTPHSTIADESLPGS